MKTTLYMVLFWMTQIVSIASMAQENNLIFTYDASGRMTERRIQVEMGARIGVTQDSTRKNRHTDIKIYPNPASSYVTIDGNLPENIKKADVVVLNLAGQILKTEVYHGNSKNIAVSDLPSGVYLIEIRYSKDERTTYKIIVKN